MKTGIRLFVAGLLTLSVATIGFAHPTFAASQQVADCSFATLQTDLQAGGDWYYASGQCSSPITFSSTITLGANASLIAQGNDVTLDGGNSVQLFMVNSGVSFGLTGLTLSHGYSNSNWNGGAITNNGTLTITNSTLSGNSALYLGGAIVNLGTATIQASTFSDNSAAYNWGGAIENASGRLQMIIQTSTFSGNTAGQDGGAINNAGFLTVTGSTLSGNSANQAAAVSNVGGGATIIGATIIANNSSYWGTSCLIDDGKYGGSITDRGYNLEDDAGASCGFTTSNHDIVGQDPQLGPLATNGGPTQTMALLSGSPAIDYIPTFSSLCSTTDQRGDNRPDSSETSCDIGAYEYQDPVTTMTTLSSSQNPSVVGKQVTYTAAVSPIPDGGTVDFQDGGSDINGCGAATVDTTAGKATCSVTYTSSGSHQITAIYSGDTKFDGSTSDTLAQTVTKVTTTTTLSSSTNPSVVGQQVTYTAAVSPTPEGGTVAFQDGGITITGCGAVTVDTSTGTATCQVTYTSPGSHTITAVYSGDDSDVGSTSNTNTQTVTSDLKTSLSLSPNPVARGQRLTISDSVTNLSTASERVTLTVTLISPSRSKATHTRSASYTLGTVTIGAGKTLSESWTETVPRNAFTGTYTVTFTAKDQTGSSSATQKETVR